MTIWPDTLRCHDCSGYAGLYMVRSEVWALAWPEYAALKAADRRKHLCLCRTCVEVRLDRHLTISDFDLSIPINSEIQFGYLLGAARVAAVAREIDELIESKDGRAMAAWFAANQNSVLQLLDATRFFEAFQATGVTEDEATTEMIEDVTALVRHGVFTPTGVAKAMQDTIDETLKGEPDE